jgi:hypothetical protein
VSSDKGLTFYLSEGMYLKQKDDYNLRNREKNSLNDDGGNLIKKKLRSEILNDNK